MEAYTELLTGPATIWVRFSRSQPPTNSLLAAFDGTNGTNPLGGVTLGSDGNFYGVTSFGGSANLGVLFKIAPTGGYTILHNFEGGGDGGEPVGPPIQAADGNFYGTTAQDSTVYKYSLSEGYSVIYQFDQTHGQEVIASLIQGTDGRLYGVADGGGASDCGTIFKLTTSGTPLWYYSFPCGAGGAAPIAPLVQSTDGSFYGTTQEQSGNGRNYGTLFKLSENGRVSTLYRFQGGDDGVEPLGLMQATDGNLYGVTQVGGSSGLGVFFTITTSGAYTILQSFTRETGAYPSAAPLQDTNGMLYGTTQSDGTHNAGTAYSIDLGLGPFIALVGYISQPSRTVQILGQSLTGTTSVTFNGVPATSFDIVLRDLYDRSHSSRSDDRPGCRNHADGNSHQQQELGDIRIIWGKSADSISGHAADRMDFLARTTTWAARPGPVLRAPDHTTFFELRACG